MSTTITKLYRYEDPSPDDLKREDSFLHYRDKPEVVRIHLSIFDVTKTTPKGWWIWSNTKFILSGEGKRFAYPTIEQARASYLRRRERQIVFLSAQLAHAEKCLDKAKAGLWAEPKELKKGDLHAAYR